MFKKRNRKIGSVKSELLKKSRESALCAAQIFNNPNIIFKFESYVVLMIIGWTYLLHAYCHSKGIDYRYYKKAGRRKRYDRITKGVHIHWQLRDTLLPKLLSGDLPASAAQSQMEEALA